MLVTCRKVNRGLIVSSPARIYLNEAFTLDVDGTQRIVIPSNHNRLFSIIISVHKHTIALFCDRFHTTVLSCELLYLHWSHILPSTYCRLFIRRSLASPRAIFSDSSPIPANPHKKNYILLLHTTRIYAH